jgi:hypothetical protein
VNEDFQKDFETRRQTLAAQIARQRGELAEAYQNLEKPIHYAEFGMRGFGFLRKNQWLFIAAPTVVSVLFSVFGAIRGRQVVKKVPGAVPPIPNPAEASKKPLAVWAGRALQLYQLYRRVRPFFL